MKHTTLKMYDTEVHVYEFNKDEKFSDHLELPENREGSLVTILSNGEYVPSSREKQSFLALGQTLDKDYVVLAEGIDSKQLGNILLSLGVKTTARASITDISKISIKQPKEEVVEEQEVEVVEEVVEEKPKPKRRSRRKTEE
jgi:carbamoylphosphate synthase small subunit